MLSILCLLGGSAFGQEKKTAAYYFDKGEQSMEKKEYISAQAHFNECLRLDPYFAEAYRLRGIVREHLGETAKALTDFNVYVDLKPTNGEALFNRALLRFEAGQYLPARQDFLKVLTLPPGETNTVYYSQEKFNEGNARIFTTQGNSRDYIYNYLGLCETKLKRYGKAIDWLDSAIRIAPTNSVYWINRGIAKNHFSDEKGAVADFEQALLLDPDNSLALHNLATLKNTGKSAENVEKLLSEAIEKNKNLPYPRAERAFQRMQKNDFTGALEDYDEVIRLDPTDDENYLNRGLVKEKLNDLKGAEHDFAKSIELNSKNEKAWLSHGNILLKSGKWAEAVEDYSTAIHLRSDYKLAYYNRGIANLHAGQTQAACSDLKNAEKFGIVIEAGIKQKACR